MAVAGLLEASSKEAVAEHIIRLGHVPVDIGEQAAAKDTGFSYAGWIERFRRVKSEELIYFSRQLSLVLSAGVPLLSALQIMASQATNEVMREAISEVAEAIEAGESLSEAMSNHPRIFSPLYMGMIRAGEAAGALDETLNRLAELGEYELENKARVQAATRYPKMVCGALVIAFFIVVYFVIPNFAKLFRQMGADLPLPTRLMIGFNDWLVQYWLISLLLLGSVVGVAVWWLKTETGLYWLDRFKVTVPIFGPLMAKFVLSRFSKVFATLNRSGLPILVTLDLSADTLGNTYYAEFVRKVREQVNKDRMCPVPWGAPGFFRPCWCRWWLSVKPRAPSMRCWTKSRTTTIRI